MKLHEKTGEIGVFTVVGCKKPNCPASTSTIAKHLINEHRIYIPNGKQDQIKQHLKPNESFRALLEKDQLEFNRLFSLAIGAATTPYIFVKTSSC